MKKCYVDKFTIAVLQWDSFCNSQLHHFDTTELYINIKLNLNKNKVPNNTTQANIKRISALFVQVKRVSMLFGY